MAAETGTLLSAFLARGEALAVHFEAFCFFAGATRFLFLDEGGWGDGLVLRGLQLAVEGDRGLLEIFQMVGNVVVDAGLRAGGEVAVGLDEQQGLVEVGRRWQPPVALAQQVQLAHILHFSLNYITFIRRAKYKALLYFTPA